MTWCHLDSQRAEGVRLTSRIVEDESRLDSGIETRPETHRCAVPVGGDSPASGPYLVVGAEQDELVATEDLVQSLPVSGVQHVAVQVVLRQYPGEDLGKSLPQLGALIVINNFRCHATPFSMENAGPSRPHTWIGLQIVKYAIEARMRSSFSASVAAVSERIRSFA